MVEKLKRLQAPKRASRRLAISGILLIVASACGVWLVVQANNKTEEFLVAVAPAASGSMITESSFRVAHLNLADVKDGYLKPGDVEPGSYLLTALAPGQLVAMGSVATAIIDSREPVTITSTMPVPATLKVGDLVDVWFSQALGNGKFAQSMKIVIDAEVSAIAEDANAIGNQEPRVQLLVPTVSVGPILDSIASKDALSLVLKRNLGND